MTRRDLLLGYSYGIGAAFCFGTAFVVVRQGVLGMTSPMVGLTFALLCGTLLLTPFAIANFDRNIKRHTKAVLFLILAGLASSFSLTLMYFALERAPVVVVSPLVYTQPLFTLVWARIFLKRRERITVRLVMGTLLIVVGVFLVVLAGA